MQRVAAVYCFEAVAGDGLEQRSELQHWQTHQSGPAEWYVDSEAQQGRSRPACNVFRTDLRAGRIGHLVVWRLDVLGLAPGALAELCGELAAAGAGLVSLRDGLALAAEDLAQVPPVLSAAFGCERRLMGQRKAEGCARARAAGVVWGGSSSGRPRKVTAELAAQVVALHAAGRPKSTIARLTGLSRPTVYRLLGQVGKRRRGPQP